MALTKEKLIEINTSHSLSALYENSWADFDSGTEWADGEYSKSAEGIVRLSGMIASGTTTSDTVIFTLPAGYRPAKREMFSCVCDVGMAVLTIKADGKVLTFADVSNSYLSLSGISFASA